MKQRARETARLRLRALLRSDAALFCQLYCDARNMRFISRPLSKAQALASLDITLRAGRTQRGPKFFSVVEKGSGAGIGLCAIQTPEVRARRVQLGLMLKSDACGRGFGTECIDALVELAFEALPIDTVWVQYRPANGAAKRLFGSFGFLPVKGAKPRAARRMHSIRALQRIAWHHRQPPTSRGNIMFNSIRFLESVGCDARLRHAGAAQLTAAMQREQIAPALRAAILSHGSTQIGDQLGVKERIHCLNFPKKAPLKAPAKPPAKKPVKKPAKKAPAKKPGKKAAPGSRRVIH